MAKISRALAQQREQRAFELFGADPTPSTAEVQDGIARTGLEPGEPGVGKMNLKRLYELRRAALARLPFPVRQPKKKGTT